TENEGMEYVSVLMYDVYHPDSEFITIYHPALTGYFQIYVDDMLVYNKTNPERIFLNQLDKRPPWGKHLVKVTYDDGNKITLVKSKYVVFGYYIALNYDESMMVGKDMDFYITLPYDADGELYLTVDGKSQKISYSNGVAEYKFNTDELEISKWYNFTLELRNDSFYPLLTDQVEFFTFLNILHFDYSSVGEKEVVGLCLPKKYNGVFKLYNAKEVKDDYVKTGKAIGTCKVVNGLASITLSGLSKGEHTFIAEFTSGGKTYEDVFSITVKKNSGKFTSSIDSNIVKIGYSVVVKITSSLKGSNEFDIYVDGVFNQTVKVGKGSVKVPFFFTTVGKHSIKVINYESGSKTPFHSNTFIVNVKSASSKDIVKLAIKKVKVKKSAKRLVLKATLKINGIAKKGLKVKFKFNKKKYTAKTNKKGVAKVTIKKKVLKKLKVGKKVKIQASYGKTVKKIKVKVKR
ncbi:MAG: hypothetical protein Q4Q18_00955, partial [Methanobrevibacter sp.]|nr:hypothetical protein [Methanobrevibacter sp.]